MASPPKKKSTRHDVKLHGKRAAKMRRVLSELNAQAERGERMSLQRAMLAAGYSESYARNSEMTEKQTWKALLDSEIPDGELLRVHKEGLKAIHKVHKIVDRDEDGKPLYDFVDVEDYATRHKYLDSGYKLKGKYAPTEHTITERRTLDEVEEEIAETLSEIGGLV